MDDIEFLTGKIVAFRPHILYVYREASGVLRFKVRDRVMKIAEDKGLHLTSPSGVSFPVALRSKSIFGPAFVVCDLTDYGSQQGGRAKIEGGLELIASGAAKNPAFLMTSDESFVTSLPSWREAITVSTYIEENVVDPANLDHALKYLIATNDLTDFSGLVRRKAIAHNIKEFVREQPRTLLEFMQYVDRAVLTRNDSSAAKFEGRIDSGASSERSRRLPNSLYAYLDHKDEPALIELLRLLDERGSRKRVEANVLTAQLYDATSSILEGKLSRRSGSSRGSRIKSDSDTFLERQLCWAARLLTWEPRLTEGNFVVVTEKLCRNFMKVSEGGDRDHLELWDNIARQLTIVDGPESGRLSGARARLRTAMKNCLARPEVSKLSEWLSQSAPVIGMSETARAAET